MRDSSTQRSVRAPAPLDAARASEDLGSGPSGSGEEDESKAAASFAVILWTRNQNFYGFYCVGFLCFFFKLFNYHCGYERYEKAKGQDIRKVKKDKRRRIPYQ